MSSLTQLKQLSEINADTADYSAIRQFEPTGVTTNPTLLMNVLKDPTLSSQLLEKTSGCSDPADRLRIAYTELCAKLAQSVPGDVSIEVNPSFAYDVDKSVNEGLDLVKKMSSLGVDKSRILIKLPATWEGCRASQILETTHSIRTNMTLVFSLVQAVAAADAGAFLISPFVGRILDWHKAKGSSFDVDPGVSRVLEVYSYYKTHNIKTKVLAASFRNIDEIKSLAGVDAMTINIPLLKELANETGCKVANKAAEATQTKTQPLSIKDKDIFMDLLTKDTMAQELLENGIKRFINDYESVLQMFQKS